MSADNQDVAVKPKPSPSKWEIYFPRKDSESGGAIYLASFPEIVYFWPTILIFLLAAFLQAFGLVNEVRLAWAAILVFSFNVLVLVQDFDQKRFVIFTLLLFVAILGLWIASLEGIPLLAAFNDYLDSFNPSMSTGAYLLLGNILLVLFLWGLFSPMFNYWRFESNEFIHYVQPLGKDMSIARAGCTVNREIPDVLESALTWGGGTLVIKREGRTLASIPNIPFLSFRMKAIEQMLSETRVTVIRESPSVS